MACKGDRHPVDSPFEGGSRAMTSKSVPTRHSTAPQEGALRILVLDEHLPSLTVAMHFLTSRGYKGCVAQRADEAIACVESFRPHFVFYEWNLRAGGGIGLARELRAVAAPSKLIIAALSAQDEPAGFSDREGIDAYFSKPFGASDLAAFVRLHCPVVDGENK